MKFFLLIVLFFALLKLYVDFWLFSSTTWFIIAFIALIKLV
jgi:hypothetical protein